jgi:uncharacterized membrane protein YjjP (DUF1212 family)
LGSAKSKISSSIYLESSVILLVRGKTVLLSKFDDLDYSIAHGMNRMANPLIVTTHESVSVFVS